MAFAVDLTGTILDRRYRLTGLLGKGGMGYVYEAVHLALDQRVAVKILHPRYAYEEKFRERFLQEARAASKIRHPNVVEIKDFGDTPDGSVYFAMEYLQGHDVGAELEAHGAMPWSRTRHILLQAASALHAAHSKHIIHRDIKPGNCFLIVDEAAGLHDVVKLLDFGIAKVGSDSHADAQGKGLTGTGEVFGTASYMSPEQVRGQALDARSDIYSLGIMAYEMLVGQVPFTGVNAIHVITRHLRDKPEPPRTYDARIPEAVEALVLDMLAKEPRDRPASMAEVERALQAIPADAGVRTTRLWSTPGELRALVAAKKTGEGAARPAGPMAWAAAEADGERTEAVLPKAAAGRGVVKRTLVSRVEERGALVLQQHRPALEPEDLIRVAVRGGPYDYQIHFEMLRRRRLLPEQLEMLVCECGSDEMLTRVGEAIAAGAQRLTDAAAAEREAERESAEKAKAPVAEDGEKQQRTFGALGVGIGMSVGGVGLLAIGIPTALRPDEIRGSTGSIETRSWRRTGIGLAAGGSAALVAGVSLLVVDLVRQRKRAVAVAPVMSPWQVGVAVAWPTERIRR